MRCLSKWMNDKKVRYKLIVVYIITGIIPILILFGICYVQIKNVLTEKEIQNIQTNLLQATSSMDTQLKIYNNLSDYVSYNQTISRIASYHYSSTYEMYEQMVKDLDPLLASFKYFYDTVDQLTIYLESDVVAHNNYMMPFSDVDGEKWAQEAMQESTLRWYIDSETKEVFSVRRMPLLKLKKGIVYIRVDYAHLFQSYGQIVENNCGIFIADTEDNMIYSDVRFEDEYKKYEMTYDQFVKAKQDKGSVYEIESVASEETGWQVYLYKPKSLMISPLQPVVLKIILGFAFCVVISLMTILFFSQFIVKRIIDLKNSMAEVEAGNLNVSIESSDKDEIGDLIRGFTKMISQTRTLIKEVYEAKISQKKHEMNALRAQINPHFLYNSLSLINWKAIEAGKEDISEITLALSAYYRTSLNKGRNTLTIREELENVNSYLKIQSVMHDNSFEVNINVDENIMTKETLNLILQPLVENAIMHGIDMREDGKGCINIRGWEKDGRIYLCVEDNGIGMPRRTAERILTYKSSGYGARNVNERIKLQYGEEYGLSIESKEGEGTIITIMIPAGGSE